jgi:hypothetical protein
MSESIIPANFHISPEAKTALYRAAYPKRWVVALMWSTVEGSEGDPGCLATGFYERHQVHPDQLAVVDGLEIAFALSERTKRHFDGKVLDLIDGKYVLREPSIR